MMRRVSPLVVVVFALALVLFGVSSALRPVGSPARVELIQPGSSPAGSDGLKLPAPELRTSAPGLATAAGLNSAPAVIVVTAPGAGQSGLGQSGATTPAAGGLNFTLIPSPVVIPATPGRKLIQPGSSMVGGDGLNHMAMSTSTVVSGVMLAAEEVISDATVEITPTLEYYYTPQPVAGTVELRPLVDDPSDPSSVILDAQ